jgi:hypothetical protein
MIKVVEKSRHAVGYGWLSLTRNSVKRYGQQAKTVDSSTKLAVGMQQNFDIGLYPQKWHFSRIPTLYTANARRILATVLHLH